MATRFLKKIPQSAERSRGG